MHNTDGNARPVIICGPGKTKQSEADACDINLIMAQYTRTGFVSHVRAGVPTFADVSAVPDYRTAIDNLRRAEEYFLTLPAKVRATFDHNVAAFLDYVSDPSTTEESIRERGLAVLEVKEKPPAAEPPADDDGA